jgi:hypothetical protein
VAPHSLSSAQLDSEAKAGKQELDDANTKMHSLQSGVITAEDALAEANQQVATLQKEANVDKPLVQCYLVGVKPASEPCAIYWPVFDVQAWDVSLETEAKTGPYLGSDHRIVICLSARNKQCAAAKCPSAFARVSKLEYHPDHLIVGFSLFVKCILLE